MTEELQALVAKDAIRDVLHRYCRGIDRWDWELLRSVYFEDSFDDHGAIARCSGPEFVEVMRRRMQLGNRIVSQHVLANILIDLDGDRARTESYFRATIGNQGSPLQFSGGRYLDQLERRHGEWRIVHRITIVEWTTLSQTGMPEHESATAGASEGFIEGRRDATDLIYQTTLPRRSRHIPEL